MNIPQIKDIKKAYEIYQTRTTLSRQDIRELFGVGNTYAGLLKSVALQHEKDIGFVQYSTKTVRTEEAFEAWGIDIERIEKRIREFEENDKNLFKK